MDIQKALLSFSKYTSHLNKRKHDHSYFLSIYFDAWDVWKIAWILKNYFIFFKSRIGFIYKIIFPKIQTDLKQKSTCT